MSENIGLYLHIPFCKSKCAYCDFYSGKASEDEYDRYASELKEKIKYWGDTARENVSSVYFGGGTPSVLGEIRLADILKTVYACFSVNPDAEITVEVNPESGKILDFDALRVAGFNRISVGLQSADEKEIQTLGRIHTPEEAALTVQRAKSAGFDNISLDLMMGIPCQTKESLKRSIDFCAACGVRHISSYILKIEEGTKFAKIKDTLDLPDEDAQAALYLFAVDYLEQLGYRQYEISNFAIPDYESRHNTLYWKCGEYIGIGPSAHSFYHGKRFHYERDFQCFYANCVTEDGIGGDEEEYIMLSLRLKKGLYFEEYEQRFQKPLSPAVMNKLKLFAKMGLIELNAERVCFTPKGFLVSNSILSVII